MGITVNPFTGQLDITGTSGGGGPTVQIPNYVHTFNVASWSGPVSGTYSQSILASIHGKGLNPGIQVFEEINPTTFQLINTETTVDVLGNILLNVSQSPDNRFNGKVIITENN